MRGLRCQKYRGQAYLGGKNNRRRFKPSYTFIALTIAFAVILISLYLLTGCTTATAAPNQTAAQDLQITVDDLLKEVDFGSIEELLKGIDDSLGLINGSFLERVTQLLNDGYASTDGLGKALVKLFFADFLKLLPLFALIVSICVVGNMLQGLSPRSETSSVIYYACFTGILVVISVTVTAVMKAVYQAIGAMQAQMNVIFPILLTFIAALGGTSSAAVYQPMTALLSQGISSLMTYFILPMFMVGFVVQILSALNPRLKLTRLSEMFYSLSKWVIGLVFAVFSAFLSVQGIYAGLHDGVSFRTAKYAISHYVPIIGGYLSDGLNMILAGSMLLKNAIGLAGILLLITTVISPVLYILGLKLVLMLCGAILEPLQDSGYAKFCSALSKSLNLLLAVLLSVAFMYLISLILLICSANYVVN